MGGLIEKLQAKMGLGFGGLGYYQQAAGVLVNTMNKSHFGVVGVVAGHIAHVPCYGVDECTVVVAATGMYYHAGRLVDYHEAVVLVNYFKGNFLRLYAAFMARTVEHEGNDIAGAHLVVALHRAVIDMNETGVGCLLYAVATAVLQLLGHEAVYAQWHLTGIRHQTDVLVEQLRVFIQKVLLVFHTHGWGHSLLYYRFYEVILGNILNGLRLR